MEESSFIVAPSILDGDNYETWAGRMTVHLQALDVWEAVEENYEVPSLGANPTVAQMKLHKERKTRKAKAKACLFAAISPSIFIKIMKIDSEIWEYLKEEYKGDERIKNMQVMNLIREFEMKKMRESHVLGKEFSNEKIVQKILEETSVTIDYCRRNLFRELDRTIISKVRIGNGDQIGLKLIYDVLFVPDINQNLLNVGQLIEKGFKVYFEDRNRIIKDAEGKKVFNIKMKGKSFALNLLEDEHAAVLQQDSTTMFWHRRLGHFHHDVVLLYMKKNQIVEGLPDLEKIFLHVLLVNMGSKLNFLSKENITRATQNYNWCIRCWWTSKDAILERECKQCSPLTHNPQQN
ncbi:hypothetical protein AAG906_011238 [Vitis piasezkii]